MPILLPYAFQVGVKAQRDILLLGKIDAMDRDLRELEEIVKKAEWPYLLCARPGVERSGWIEGPAPMLFLDVTGAAYDAVCERFENKDGSTTIPGVGLYLYPLAMALKDRDLYEARGPEVD